MITIRRHSKRSTVHARTNLDAKVVERRYTPAHRAKATSFVRANRIPFEWGRQPQIGACHRDSLSINDNAPNSDESAPAPGQRGNEEADAQTHDGCDAKQNFCPSFVHSPSLVRLTGHEFSCEGPR